MMIQVAPTIKKKWRLWKKQLPLDVLILPAVILIVLIMRHPTNTLMNTQITLHPQRQHPLRVAMESVTILPVPIPIVLMILTTIRTHTRTLLRSTAVANARILVAPRTMTTRIRIPIHTLIRMTTKKTRHMQALEPLSIGPVVPFIPSACYPF